MIYYSQAIMSCASMAKHWTDNNLYWQTLPEQYNVQSTGNAKGKIKIAIDNKHNLQLNCICIG